MLPEFIKESDFWGSIFAIAAFGLLLLAAVVVQVIFQLIIKHRIKGASESLDTQLLKVIRGPIVLVIVFFAFVAGMSAVSSLYSSRFEGLNDLNKWFTRAWIVIVIGQLSYLASRISQVLMGWYIKAIAARTSVGVETRLLPPVQRILPIVIYSVAFMVALESLDISISPLLAGFGIGGLAVALAVQPSLGNFFAGTYLVTEGELKTGDFIEIQGGPSGFVVDIGWRSTKIRSRFNNLVVVPNSKMADSVITNFYSPEPALNVIVDGGVSYDADLVNVERIVREVAGNIVMNSPDAVKDAEPFFGFNEFGDSNINFWVFIQAKDRAASFTLKSELIKDIKRRFNEEGIDINYPVRKIVR